jgi:MFS family permease
MRYDRRVLLLSMLNFTFGFSSAFVNTFITGVVIPRSLGADKVGYLVSIIPLTAALAAMPIAAMTERIGSKTPAMLLGGAAFAVFYLPFFVSAASLDEQDCVASSGGGEVRSPKLTVGCSHSSLHTNKLPCYCSSWKRTQRRG